MKKNTFIISITVIAIITLTVLTILLLGNKNNNYSYDESIISNSFEYEQSITNESIEDIYYYSDSYFNKSSKLENEHLRTFALSLALSFNPTNRKDRNNYNIDKIFEELSFKNIEYYDLNEFNKNTIGTAISHKKLNNKFELVTVVLRGAGYKEEWESNLDVGENGNIKGFDDASKKVLSRLEDYLNKYNINDYKLLITGYSRAGAISGLIGVYIDNNLEEYNIKEDNLFVYSFESPRYSSDNIIYENIHNVINKSDIVTYVYPESWGLYHNGKDEEITTNNNIKEKYLDILSNEKIKELKEINTQKFIQRFINLLPNDREKYYEVSYSILDAYNIINNKNTYEKEKLINFIKNTKIDLNLENSFTILSLINSSDEKTIRKAFDSITSNYDKEYSKISSILSKEEYNKLKDDIFNIYLYLQPSIKKDYQNNYMFNNLITFSSNLEDIFKEHYFSVNLKQVQMKDSYFNEVPN